MIIFLISKIFSEEKMIGKMFGKVLKHSKMKVLGGFARRRRRKKSVFWGISEEKLTSIPPLLLTDLKQGGILVKIPTDVYELTLHQISAESIEWFWRNHDFFNIFQH